MQSFSENMQLFADVRIVCGTRFVRRFDNKNSQAAFSMQVSENGARNRNNSPLFQPPTRIVGERRAEFGVLDAEIDIRLQPTEL